ncbi:MAG: ankyrin repeat domain-containing protein [Planctomycetota bacterium]
MANHPIFAATFHGDVAVVKTLLDEDSSLIAVRDAQDLTPLHVAASRGKLDVAKLLIERGADIAGPSKDEQWTPLIYAAYRGHTKLVEFLVAHGAGVTAADGNPIHYSGQRRHKEICRILVQSGALEGLVDTEDPDVVNLFRAAYSYDAESANEILARRPELVDWKDKDGRTAIHEACTQGDTKTVRTLLSFGANLEIRDKYGHTPEDRASSHRQHAVSQIIERHKAAIR